MERQGRSFSFAPPHGRYHRRPVGKAWGDGAAKWGSTVTQRRGDPQQAQGLLALAMNAVAAGNASAAVELLQRAHAADAANPEIAFRLGLGLRQSGDEQGALAALDRALALAPGHPAILNARGLALRGLGRVDEALAAYEQAIARTPRFAEAHNNRGVVLRQLRRMDEAVHAFRAAAAAQPELAEVHNNLGWTLHLAGRYEEALACYQDALRLRPRDAQVLSNLGATLHKLARHDEAVAALRQSLALQAGSWETLMNLGVALSGQGRNEEALAAFDQAQALAPGQPDLLVNRGNAMVELGRHDEALAVYEKARSARPDDAEVAMNIANAWRQANEHAQARPGYERALALAPDDPDIRFNFSLSLLADGDYARGWPLYESRWQARHLRKVEPEFGVPKWMGAQDLAGRTLLLWDEQGLGDTLWMCRYASLAAERGARVLLRAQQPLVGLLREGLPGVAEVFGPDDALPPFDLHCPLMSLPLAFGTTRETVPPQVGYLRPAPERVRKWREALHSPSPKVGLCWSGNPRFATDYRRSLSLTTLLPVLPEGAEYWCLPKDLPERELALLQQTDRIRRFGDRPFTDTAAQMLCMDLIVTTDTSIANLAGALGCPALVLLGFSSDFRWLTDTPRTPWYPTLELLRQPSPGEWGDVLAQVRERIGALIAGR
jgi:tetratricopeptide (TPR) repeat protein